MNLDIRDHEGRPVDLEDLDEDTQRDLMNYDLAYRRGWREATAAAKAAAPSPEPIVINITLNDVAVSSLPDRVHGIVRDAKGNPIGSIETDA